MNFEYHALKPPLCVFMANPLVPEAKMLAVKIFNGLVFGFDHLINMTLLVYDNELKYAIEWRRELEMTSAPLFNSVEVTTTIPDVADADVFVIYTQFKNPNVFSLEDINTAECFDSVYLLLKIASNLKLPIKTPEDLEKEKEEEEKYFKKYKKGPLKRKPIFMCDGLVPMDILHTFSTNVPSTSFFCPTPVPAIATSILGDHLKVKCRDINRIHLFGANDQVFHIDFERPLFRQDIEIYHENRNEHSCEWDLVGNKRLEELNVDYHVFNAAWLKKEFMDKVKTVSSGNLFGPLFKSARMTKALRAIYRSRSHPEMSPIYRVVGAISDGSLETIKGLPYVFPLIFNGDTWQVNKYFADDYFVKAEIKRFNKIVAEQHAKLIPYCRKFLQHNVIEQKFVPKDIDSSNTSAYSSMDSDESQSI